MYLAHIRFAEEHKELIPLTKLGVEYVFRHGDTYQAYYKLDYSTVEEYGYAYPNEEVPEHLVPKDLIHIYTLFCKDMPFLKMNGC